MAEDMGSYIHKGLSEWWSEESTYLFHRIERWAAFARGYNRLRSVHLSKARMTMQVEKSNDDIYWCNSTSNIHSMRRSQSPSEAGRINCCGTFNYQSNSHFDSACLEAYRYDHSIYFKTIGDIKNSKRQFNNSKHNACSQPNKFDDNQCLYYSYCNNDSQVEFNLVRVHYNNSDNNENKNNNCTSLGGHEDGDDSQVKVVEPNGDVHWDYLYDNSTTKSNDPKIERMFNNVWPIVENQKIPPQHQPYHYDDDNNNNNNNSNNSNNNSNVQCENRVSSLSGGCEKTANIANRENFTKILSFRKSKKSSKTSALKSMIASSDNDITRPDVFLNYTIDNMDPSSISASYQHTLNAK